MVVNSLLLAQIVNFSMGNMLFLVSDFLRKKIFLFLFCFVSILGRVIEGMLVVRKVENVPVALNNKPKIPVIVSQCGEM